MAMLSPALRGVALLCLLLAAVCLVFWVVSFMDTSKCDPLHWD